MDLYTYTLIYTGNNDSTHVWYWDGTVTYGGQLRMMITLISTPLVAVLIMHYFTLLLGARPLMKIFLINKYFQPVVESIHAPYKDRYQYWLVARMIFLVGMYVIYIALRGKSFSNMVALISGVLMMFLLVQAYTCTSNHSKTYSSMHLDSLLKVNLPCNAFSVGVLWEKQVKG